MRAACLTFLVWFFSAGIALAQYSAALIPADLKEGVDVVVREDISRWRILARDRATIDVRYVVTVLNTNGDGYAEINLGYDKKLEKITDLKINVYDALGLPVKRVKNNEIMDVSLLDGVSLFSDNRIKNVDVSQSTYPYTVELEYREEYRYLYSNHGSVLLSSPRMSCENFQYQITYPKELAPRYRVHNFDSEPKKITNPDGTESLTWEARNVKAKKPEPSGPPFRATRPEIIAAPSEFEFSGYGGKMNTWDDLSSWIMSLNKGRDIISDATRRQVAELTRNLTSAEEKSKVLYEYLQGKTRYVSIQLGIGGLQPFEAKVVDQVGYGDCKALSNYMVALLTEAGITGYYTLINAGEEAPPMITDFPSSQFNHVVVAVPNGKDTLWLECTSQTNPFGYQGTFTGDRKALMVTEAGGKIVNTTRYPASGNVRQRIANVDLQAGGDAKAKVATTYSGLRYEAGDLNHYINQPQEDQKKWLLETTRIPNFNIDQFKMVNHKMREPSAEVQIAMTLRRYASVSGKRIFMMPNLMSRSAFVPEQSTDRKSNVLVKTGFVDEDSVVYTIPESIYPEFVPQSIRHESRFGTYEASFVLDQGKLIYVRRLVTKEGEFPPESYKEFVEFYRNVNKADNLKMVFLSKT
jgi:hypothetical protein